MAWLVKGGSGFALNGALRSLASINADSGKVRFQTLAADTLTWTAATTDATGAGTIIPDYGQVVQLYKDDSSARKFYGWCTKAEVKAGTVTVEAQGPWWWMQRIYLTQDQTDQNGGTSERTQYVFPTGDLRTSIIALLDRAIANGVPMTRGTGSQIAAMYDFTRITLSNMTIAEALTQMLARVPDAVVWFDYQVEGELPKLKIARRNGADAVASIDLTIGTDLVETDLRIYPRLDLEVKRVEIPYMDRHPTTGRARFQRQGAGTTETGKLQIVTGSGPEIVDFLPKSDFESASVQTVNAGSVTSAFISATDAQLAAIKKQFGIQGAVGNTVTTYTGSTGPGGTVTQNKRTFPGQVFTRDNGNVIGTLTGRYLVISPDLPQWAFEQYKGINVTISGTWIAIWDAALHGGAGWDDGFAALREGAVTGAGNFNDNLTGYKSWLARPFTCRAVLIAVNADASVNPPFATAKTVYKIPDYDFIQPPAGMATGLRVAQDWVPWEGEIPVAGDDVTATNQLGKVINVMGAQTACATMGALLKSNTHDLFTGQTLYQLGAPARTNLATAMGRVPSNPQDVIIELT